MTTSTLRLVARQVGRSAQVMGLVSLGAHRQGLHPENSQLSQHPRVSMAWTRCTTDFGRETLRKRVVFSRGETRKQSCDCLDCHTTARVTVFRAGQLKPPIARSGHPSAQQPRRCVAVDR